MLKRRILWIDSLKGILILLVILGHCIQDADKNYLQNTSWNLIYSFHMPMFMALSGYVTYPLKGEPSVNLKKRAKELLVPFFSWTFIIGLFSGNPFSRIYNAILYPDLSYWFIWALFFIIFLFSIAYKISELIKIKPEYMIVVTATILCIVMILLEFRLFGFQFITYYFIFFSLGYFIKKHISLNFRNILFILLIFTLWLMGGIFWNMHALPPFLDNIPYVPKSLLIYVYRLSVGILGVFLLFIISPHLFNKDSKLNRALAILGSWTLGIYIVHLAIPFNKLMIADAPLIVNVIYLFLARLVISVAVVKIISLEKNLSVILLGKRK
ncbi:acyltransferase family protein [Nubsella zeaxanthinifaciens]|uniref:acyltransferase family protein n=1 Tax=Nubsella zeaxanthinifaciens TaxID=392412 RepID=UPI000DE26223|nr:acyltransferase family protein [Nubsella zeaxanthinifaciens]